MSTWYNNRTRDGVWRGEEFDSREEAIGDGVEQYRCSLNGEDTELFDAKLSDDDYPYPPSSVFYIGEKDPFIPEIDVYSIIEQLQEDAYDQCGEVAEDFLYWDYQDYDKMKDMLNELKTKLELDLDVWLRKHDLYPAFFSIKNIEEIASEYYV